ncbi:MAG: DUF465 domain-containing protein [Boseongicola sp.]|jgi:hypothetical protein|nr:DUF465 domain-containing protein [Boseongicola sp.]
MSLSSHLKELRNKHETLSQEVEQAQRSPAFDDIQITALKRQKLKIKEEIERLSESANA